MKKPKVNYSFETVHNHRSHLMRNALRDFPPIPAAQSYCGGALVDGAAGALVDGIAGGVPVSACFLQPVNNPTQTNPEITTNDNIFFIRG
ncbi:MAG: hypothetical protein ACLP2Y_14005 [Limisphaerales bacterium]